MMTIQEKIRRHMATHPRRATQDSRRIHVSERMSTRDQKIVADPAPRNPEIFGNTTAFTGKLANMVAAVRVAIEALPAEQRGAARAFAVRDIAGYGGELADGQTTGTLGRGPAGSLATQGDRPEKEFSVDVAGTPAAMQSANVDYWDTRAGNRYKARDRAAEISRPGTPASINLANAQFYANQPKATTRRWGER